MVPVGNISQLTRQGQRLVIRVVKRSEGAVRQEELTAGEQVQEFESSRATN